MTQLFKGMLVGTVAGFLICLGILGTGGTMKTEFVGKHPHGASVVLTYVTNLPVGDRKVHGIIEEGMGYTNIHYCGWNFDVYPHPKEFDLFSNLCFRMNMARKRPPLNETFSHPSYDY